MALLTKDIFVTGEPESGSNRFTFILRITQNSVRVSDNTSNVTVAAILKQAVGSSCFQNIRGGVSCTVNGKTLFSDYTLRTLEGDQEHVYYTWNGDLAHNNDGTLDLSVQGKFWLVETGGRLPPRMVIEEQTVSLVQILRNTSVGASDACIGSNSTVVIVPPVGNYQWSVGYCFGALSGYLYPDGSVGDTECLMTERIISFLIPEAFYDQIPEQPSDSCVLEVTTYADDAKVGIAQTRFLITADKSRCAPLLTATVTDSNENTVAATGDANTLVRFGSTALCQASAQGQYGASVVSVRVNGLPMEESLSIEAPETGQYLFEAVDSRGYTTGLLVEKPLLPYVRLTCDPTARRTAPTTGQVELTVSGNCWTGSFGAVENTLTGAYRIGDGAWQSIAVQQDDTDTYQATVLIEGLDYTMSYRIEVCMTDSLGSVTVQVPVQRGIPVFDWGENYFNFHVPVYFGAGASGLT